MTEKNIANLEPTSALSREITRKNDQYISPSVDIFETEEGLTLVADMPGLDDRQPGRHHRAGRPDPAGQCAGRCR